MVEVPEEHYITPYIKRGRERSVGSRSLLKIQANPKRVTGMLRSMPGGFVETRVALMVEAVRPQMLVLSRCITLSIHNLHRFVDLDCDFITGLCSRFLLVALGPRVLKRGIMHAVSMG